MYVFDDSRNDTNNYEYEKHPKIYQLIHNYFLKFIYIYSREFPRFHFLRHFLRHAEFIIRKTSTSYCLADSCVLRRMRTNRGQHWNWKRNIDEICHATKQFHLPKYFPRIDQLGKRIHWINRYSIKAEIIIKNNKVLFLQSLHFSFYSFKCLINTWTYGKASNKPVMKRLSFTIKKGLRLGNLKIYFEFAVELKLVVGMLVVVCS